VKISSKFLLSSVFVVLFAMGVAPVDAQVSLGCADLQEGHDFEVGTQDIQGAVEHLQTRVKKLEACLSEMQLNMSIADPNLTVDQIDDNRKKLITAETKIDDLEASLHLIEIRLAHTEDEIEWLAAKPPASKRKAPASHPNSPVNKPTPAKDGTHRSRRRGAVNSQFSPQNRRTLEPLFVYSMILATTS